jgi:hypothetical protein
MPSVALSWWQTAAQQTLNSMVNVHATVGGHGPGRRYATEQIDNAYVVLLSSQFQKYCRDLHSQASDHIANQAPASIRNVVLARFTEGRKLDTGNPNPGNLGSDFNRFGFGFWDEIRTADTRNAGRQEKLEELNLWRNAIGYHDFSNPALATRTAVRLNEVNGWRRACNALASQFDGVLCRHLTTMTGAAPW